MLENDIVYDQAYQFNQESIYNQTCKKNADIIICLPEEKVHFFGILMAIYSYIPVVVFLVLITWYIIKRTIVPLLVLAALLLTLLINEVILKNIIKQPRPLGSCACSYGMPSGHSITSALLLFWILFEFVHPLDKSISKLKRAIYVVLAFAAFAMVPYSRVYLLYHTWLQVLVGSLIGLAFAIIVFLVLRVKLIHHLPKREIFFKTRLVIKNNYRIVELTTTQTEILLMDPLSNENSTTTAAMTTTTTIEYNEAISRSGGSIQFSNNNFQNESSNYLSIGQEDDRMERGGILSISSSSKSIKFL